MARMLRPAEDLLAPSVHAAINALQPGPEDSGAVQLAQSYARAIDQAHIIAAQLDALEIDDEDTLKRVNVLAAKVNDIVTLDRLGPKLLAALESLGATPRARSLLKSPTGTPGNGKLATLRAAR